MKKTVVHATIVAVALAIIISPPGTIAAGLIATGLTFLGVVEWALPLAWFVVALAVALTLLSIFTFGKKHLPKRARMS